MTAKIYLQQAQNSRTVTDAGRTSREEEDLLWDAILNCIPLGVLTLDPKLYILKSNIVAKAFLDCGDGLHEYKGHLRASSPTCTYMMMEALKRMTQAVGAARNTLPAAVFPIPRMSSDRELEVVLKSAPSISSGNSRNAAAIAFICDPSRNTSSAKEIFASLYQLSPAEARLSALLMQGKSLHEAAVLLNVKKGTVRKQLQAIFDKTHTSRQGILMRLFMGGVASLEIPAPIYTSDAAPARIDHDGVPRMSCQSTHSRQLGARNRSICPQRSA